MDKHHCKTIAEGDTYLAFPDVAVTPAGKLVCVYFEGDRHSPSWSQVVVKTSSDLGETWTAPCILAKAALRDDGFCWNCPRISALPDGRIVIICDYEDHSKERAIWAWWSEDGAASWSAPRKLLSRGLVPDRVVALSSGRLLLAVPCEEQGTILFSSSNDGASWDEWAQIRPTVDPKSAESSLVVLDGLRMVCYTRGGECAPGPKSISLDGGRRWDDRAMSCFAGHRPCAGMLRSGRVLVTFRLVNVGICAYIESPESALDPEYKTQRGTMLELETAQHNYFWDYGYTGWVQLPDDRLFCVYYTKKPSNDFPLPATQPCIRGCWFSEHDFRPAPPQG